MFPNGSYGSDGVTISKPEEFFKCFADFLFKTFNCNGGTENEVEFRDVDRKPEMGYPCTIPSEFRFLRQFTRECEIH